MSLQYTEMCNVRLTPEIKRGIPAAAARHGLKPAEFVRFLLTLAIKNELSIQLHQREEVTNGQLPAAR